MKAPAEPPQGRCVLCSRCQFFVSALVLFLLAGVSGLHGQTATVGVLRNDGGLSPGLNLFSPAPARTAYLLDNDGHVRHYWRSTYTPGQAVELLPNGNLLRTGNVTDVPTGISAGGGGGVLQEFDWDGNLVWEYFYISTTVRAHHDFAVLPNGNILILAWELRDMAECIAAGRDPAILPDNELWPEHIIEVEPVGASGGNIVWSWHVWDHMVQDFDNTKDNFGVVADHPELIDINYAPSTVADWIHANAIDYNEDLDQIAISSPRFGEVWVIDHSTTTAEAAGHTGGDSGMGGDLLYRWGNPQTYGAGTAGDQILWFSHDVQWIRNGLTGAGNILIFNNGNGRPGPTFSTVEEITPPLNVSNTYDLTPGTAYGPASPTWIYTANPTEPMYSAAVSGAQRLPNGNTLICAGVGGEFREVTSAGTMLWQYINPVNAGEVHTTQGNATGFNLVFRVNRYPLDFPAFAGKELPDYGKLELPLHSTFVAKDVRKVATGWEISWSGLPLEDYRVEYTASLDSPTWVEVTTVSAPVTTIRAVDTDPGRAAAPQGHYRIVHVP